MDSYRDNSGRMWTACHECVFGGNGMRSCNIGGTIIRNTLNRGCWAGDVIKRKDHKHENEGLLPENPGK